MRSLAPVRVVDVGATELGLTPLVRVKLRPPGVPPHYVHRARLLGLLDEAVAAPLTLLVAPAGSGKTMLLAGWTAAATFPTAWISLDEGDRDAAHLWRAVIVALETLSPGCGAGAWGMLHGPETVVDAVGQLLDDIDRLPNPLSVLVIDDAHLANAGEAVAESLALFLQHLPPWLRAVVASRRDMELPLDRLRARGQLSEIRFNELRFTREEADDLLSHLAPSLADDEIDVAVAVRTAGRRACSWPRSPRARPRRATTSWRSATTTP